MKKSLTKTPNKIRIIGGKWRGRLLTFPDSAALRPTPNRIRETLFNWLAPVIYGAHCLDLFAGSGALGFEALSRGAMSATLIDNQPITLKFLQQNKVLLAAEKASIIDLKIPYSTLATEQPFDIVFLDPPFTENLIGPCCEWLENQKLLSSHAYIYIETEKTLNTLDVPSHWKMLKSKVAGQVSYYLYKTN